MTFTDIYYNGYKCDEMWLNGNKIWSAEENLDEYDTVVTCLYVGESATTYSFDKITSGKQSYINGVATSSYTCQPNEIVRLYMKNLTIDYAFGNILIPLKIDKLYIREYDDGVFPYFCYLPEYTYSWKPQNFNFKWKPNVLDKCFINCRYLTDDMMAQLIPTYFPSTSNVTSMWRTFASCQSLTTLDLSSWDTSKVTSFMECFRGCYKLKSLNLYGWDTSSIDTNSSSSTMLMFDGMEDCTIYVGRKWTLGTSATLGGGSNLTFINLDGKFDNDIDNDANITLDYTGGKMPTIPTWFTEVAKGSTYYFTHEPNTGLKQNNTDVHSSVAWSCYKVDEKATGGKMTIAYTVGTESATYDYFTIHQTTSSTQPSYSSETDRLVKVGGELTSDSITIDITGTTYIHFQYRKDASYSGNTDSAYITQIKFTGLGSGSGGTEPDIPTPSTGNVLDFTQSTLPTMNDVTLYQNDSKYFVHTSGEGLKSNANAWTTAYTCYKIENFTGSFTIDYYINETYYNTFAIHVTTSPNKYVISEPANRVAYVEGEGQQISHTDSVTVNNLKADKTYYVHFQFYASNNISWAIIKKMSFDGTFGESGGTTEPDVPDVPDVPDIPSGETGAVFVDDATWDSDLEPLAFTNTKLTDRYSLFTNESDVSQGIVKLTQTTSTTSTYQTGKCSLQTTSSTTYYTPDTYFKMSFKVRGKCSSSLNSYQPYLMSGTTLNFSNLSETDYTEYRFVLYGNNSVNIYLYANAVGDWIEVSDIKIKEYDTMPPFPSSNSLYQLDNLQSWTYSTMNKGSSATYSNISYDSSTDIATYTQTSTSTYASVRSQNIYVPIGYPCKFNFTLVDTGTEPPMVAINSSTYKYKEMTVYGTQYEFIVPPELYLILPDTQRYIEFIGCNADGSKLGANGNGVSFGIQGLTLTQTKYE